MHIIQKIVLKDFAFSLEQLYLFCYLRFVLHIFIGGGGTVNIGGFNFIWNQNIFSLVFPIFGLGQTDCVITQSDWLSLLPRTPYPPQNKIQPPSEFLYNLVLLCLPSFISCHLSHRIFHQIQTLAVFLTQRYFTPPCFPSLVYLAWVGIIQILMQNCPICIMALKFYKWYNLRWIIPCTCFLFARAGMIVSISHGCCQD